MDLQIGIWKIEEGEKEADRITIYPGPKTFDEASLQLPSGVYTTFRTYQRSKVLHPEYHLARLDNSARLAGVNIALNEAALRKAVYTILEKDYHMDTRVRLQVDLRSHPGDVYILIEPLRIPSEEQYRNGVSVVTKPLVRENPKAKQTSFIRLAEAERHQLAPGIFEEVMLDSKSRMLEGLSSNFFVIVRGEIWTAEAGVLSGVTRSIILEEADRLEYPARLEGYPSDRLSEIQEAFLSSSSRGVVPVVSINGEPVGKRIPGPITQAIAEAYNNRVKTDVVEIKPI